MTNTPADNAKHFPQDLVWQRHCELMSHFIDLRPLGYSAEGMRVPVLGRVS